MTVDKTGVDETVVDKTGVDETVVDETGVGCYPWQDFPTKLMVLRWH